MTLIPCIHLTRTDQNLFQIVGEVEVPVNQDVSEQLGQETGAPEESVSEATMKKTIDEALARIIASQDPEDQKERVYQRIVEKSKEEGQASTVANTPSEVFGEQAEMLIQGKEEVCEEDKRAKTERTKVQDEKRERNIPTPKEKIEHCKQVNNSGKTTKEPKSRNNSSKQEFERKIPKKVYKDEKSPKYIAATMHPKKFKNAVDPRAPGSDSQNEAIIHVDNVQSDVKSASSSYESHTYGSESKSRSYHGSKESLMGRLDSSPYLSSYPSGGFSTNSSSRLTLPSINTSGQVQLTTGSKFTKSTSERSATNGRRTKTLIAKANKVAKRLRQQAHAPDILTIDTPPTEQSQEFVEKPKVPVNLKAAALMRNGQLEISVIDDKNGVPDSGNVNIKITLVHKTVGGKNRGHAKLRKKNFKCSFHNNIDRDVLRHRAMYPPFNTHTKQEASERHNQFYGLK